MDTGIDSLNAAHTPVLKCYADDADDELVAESIEGIGHIARVVPESTAQCLSALMSFIQSKHGKVSMHPHFDESS